MKKRFTILMAACIMLLIMFANPMRVIGQTRTEVTLWSEDFSNYSANDVPSGGTYSYVCTNGTGTKPGETKVMSESLAGSTSPELMVGKKGSGTGATGGKFTATIPLDNIEGTLTLTYYQNKQSLSVSSTTSGVSGGQTLKPSEAGQQSTTFTGITTSMTSITIVFQATTTNNVRLDNIVLIGTSAGGSLTPSNLAITGDPVALSFDLYNNSAAQTVSYTTSSTGAITITPASPTSYFSYVHNAAAKTITVTPIAVTPSAQTVTISQEADATYAAGSKTFTVSVANSAPLANIAALTTNTVSGTYNVTFTDAVVTYVNGKYAYIQDASGAVLYYNNDGHSLTAGNILNGTATVSYMLQNNTPEITALSGVTPTSGAAPNPTTVVASEWDYTFNNVLSQYFKITDAKIIFSSNKYYVSVGSSAKAVENIQLYGRGNATNFSIDNLTNDDVFTIIGFPMLYNNTKEFQIFIVPQKAEININASALELSYAANASGSMTVGYPNFTPTSVSAALYSDSGCNTAFSGDWISITSPLTTPFTSLAYNVSANETVANRTVYMKVSATNANGTTIEKIFTITQVFHTTYSVTYNANEGTGANVVDSGYDYNANVTVKPNNGIDGNPNFTRVGYTFVNWNTESNGSGGSSYDAGDEFQITQNTTLYAQWEADAHDITTVVNPASSGSVSYKVGDVVVTTPHTDETVTLVVAPATGYALASLIVTNDETQETVSVENNTFTMPANDITVTATFEEVFSYNVDFESAMSTYTDWVYSNIIAEQTTITGHGGSGKYGKTDGTTTAYIQTKTKIASPGTFVCYISKIGTNTNANSKWKVQYSSNGSTWTTVGDEQNAAVGITEGTWTKIERDLSSQSNVFVRIYYDGTTAIRTIDDISLEYTPTPKYNLFVASVDNLTITAESGSVNVAEGETKELESGKTVTLSATPASGYNFIAWDVYKTGESSTKVEVNDNQFDMPSYAVTVTATCIETRTITYSINGATSSTTHNIGNVISLEDPDSGIPTGYDFVGWTENPANTADGNLITSITLNANKTVYAVFKKSNTITITGDDFGAYEKDGEVEATMQNTKWGRYYVMKNSGIQFHKKDGYFYNKTEFNNLVSLVATRSGSDHVIVKTATSIDDWSSASALSITSTSGNADTYTIPSGHTHVLLTNDGVDATTKYTSFAFVFNVDETRYTQVYTETTTTASGDIYITGKTIIPSGSTLNMNGHELHNTIAANLIIEDGGQLITSSANVKATVKKNITAPSAWTQDNKTGWYAISSTVGTISDITSVSNFANQTFDLYKYVESSNVGYGWINYAAHTEDFGGLVNGQGYLYARKDGATVSFTGNVNHTDVTLTGLTAKNSANENLRGIHLIGNPYTHNIYKGVAITATKGAMSSTYYRLDGNNLWVVESDDNPIGPGQGFLVKVTDGTDLTFRNNASAPGSKANNDYIRFAVSNSEYEDATFALFQKGEGLRKINHRNTEAPMIYISQNDANYASATMDDDTKSFNLNFEAKTMGQYKLSYKVNGEFNYLHVIDRTTGEDIDMLLEGSYSFIGSPMDNANRFIVRLGYLPNYDDNGKDIFAYQNGNDIVVSGEGELQIFDVMGRKVSTMNIYGIETVNGLAQGVHIFRLEGKTQKIVVR